MATTSDVAVLRGQLTYKAYACPKLGLDPSRYTSIVPAKLQDLRPSPSFTKSSMVGKGVLYMPPLAMSPLQSQLVTQSSISCV